MRRTGVMGMGGVAMLAWVFWAASVQPASAYLDPATGSYLLQLAIASLVAVPFAIRGFLGRLFRRRRPPEEPKESEQERAG